MYKNLKIRSEIPLLTCLTESPDMTIVENMWYVIKLKLHTETEVIKTLAESINMVFDIWMSLHFYVTRIPYVFFHVFIK